MKIKLLLLICFITSALSCRNESHFLEKAIRGDAKICPLVYSGDSEIVLICILSSNLIEELLKNQKIDNPEEYIFAHMKTNSPIKISEEFYSNLLEHQYRISANSTIDSIYSYCGVRGLVDQYFKKGLTDEDNEDGLLILYNEQERFVVKGMEPYPSFGENTNTDYIVYLLSKHDVYLTLTFIDDMLMLIVDKSISDMEVLR